MKATGECADRLRRVTKAVQDEHTARTDIQRNWLRAFSDIGLTRGLVGGRLVASPHDAARKPDGSGGRRGGQEAERDERQKTG